MGEEREEVAAQARAVIAAVRGQPNYGDLLTLAEDTRPPPWASATTAPTSGRSLSRSDQVKTGVPLDRGGRKPRRRPGGAAAGAGTGSSGGTAPAGVQGGRIRPRPLAPPGDCPDDDRAAAG